MQAEALLHIPTQGIAIGGFRTCLQATGHKPVTCRNVLADMSQECGRGEWLGKSCPVTMTLFKIWTACLEVGVCNDDGYDTVANESLFLLHR
jgi:hypothetical protein